MHFDKNMFTLSELLLAGLTLGLGLGLPFNFAFEIDNV